MNRISPAILQVTQIFSNTLTPQPGYLSSSHFSGQVIAQAKRLSWQWCVSDTNFRKNTHPWLMRVSPVSVQVGSLLSVIITGTSTISPKAHYMLSNTSFPERQDRQLGGKEARKTMQIQPPIIWHHGDISPTHQPTPSNTKQYTWDQEYGSITICYACIPNPHFHGLHMKLVCWEYKQAVLLHEIVQQTKSLLSSSRQQDSM